MALSEAGATQLGTGKARAMIFWYYTVYWRWGPRRETPEALAAWFNKLVDNWL